MTDPLDARELALSLLAASDYSTEGLAQALARRGVPEQECSRVVRGLANAGLVDDGRSAALRAETLAGRGKGDAAIAADLERRGFPPDTVAEAIAGLPAEVERARLLVARRGRTPATMRLLRSRGFSEESAEIAVAAADEPWLG